MKDFQVVDQDYEVVQTLTDDVSRVGGEEYTQGSSYYSVSRVGGPCASGRPFVTVPWYYIGLFPNVFHDFSVCPPTGWVGSLVSS